MGVITSMATVLGGWSAGAGAMMITEGVVNTVGNSVVHGGKMAKFCVYMCGCTLGGAAFNKVNDMFTEQAIEFFEACDKLKEIRKEWKEAREEDEKDPVDRDAAIGEAENILKQADKSFEALKKLDKEA